MGDDIDRLVEEIEAAVARLAGSSPAGRPRTAETLGARFAAWRQAVAEHRDLHLRDRAIWALLGAERHLRAMQGSSDNDADAHAARVRLEAAARTLREMAPPYPPDPLPG